MTFLFNFLVGQPSISWFYPVLIEDSWSWPLNRVNQLQNKGQAHCPVQSLKRLLVDLPSAQENLAWPQQSLQGLGAPKRSGFPSECIESGFQGVEGVRGKRNEELNWFVDVSCLLWVILRANSGHHLWLRSSWQPRSGAWLLPSLNVGTYSYASVFSLIKCRY